MTCSSLVVARSHSLLSLWCLPFNDVTLPLSICLMRWMLLSTPNTDQQLEVSIVTYCHPCVHPCPSIHLLLYPSIHPFDDPSILLAVSGCALLSCLPSNTYLGSSGYPLHAYLILPLIIYPFIHLPRVSSRHIVLSSLAPYWFPQLTNLLNLSALHLTAHNSVPGTAY